MRQLSKLLHHAYENVPYYQRVFDERKLKPRDIQNFDDLKKLPFLIKPDTHGRLKYCARVQNQSYPARHLVVEMLRREGNVMPEIVKYQAMQILTALGFEITES